ncbi:hypothetical protein JXR93_03280 [bacterium]|nr:hypothetical protein [bacterium]
MKKLGLIFLILSLFSFGTLLFADEEGGSDDNTKVFDFDAADISGTKTKPAGSRIDSLNTSKAKTQIRPREDFLPELSNSVDEL